jgi:hypothetical protein
MPLKEGKKNKFTGFMAYYDHNESVPEKENYFSKSLNKHCATNWSEINKDKLVALSLYWNGEFIIKVAKADNPEIAADTWFFSQTAYLDMKVGHAVVLSRNIGYKKKDGTTQIFSVEEATGRLTSNVRRTK